MSQIQPRLHTTPPAPTAVSRPSSPPAAEVPSRPASAPPEMPEFPKPEPGGPKPWALSLPRPDSPTYRSLREHADRGTFGDLTVPSRPARTRPADVHEQAAIDMFRTHMDEADPTGVMRALGEFFQTFTAKPQEMDFVANHPIHYQGGSQVNAPPPDAFPPGTTHIVHSHPPAPAGSTNAFPSPQDYFGMYRINEGGRRDMQGILHSVEGNQNFAFQGKVNPETGKPEFERLTRSGMQQMQEWFAQYGHEFPGQAAPPGGSAPG